MPITNQKKWDNFVSKNNDSYGKACVDTARKVMEILDKEKDFDCHDLIVRASKEVKSGGLTGFMAGAVASMINSCHSRGEEFKKKWNKGYGDENRKGVINPALITIKTNPNK